MAAAMEATAAAVSSDRTMVVASSVCSPLAESSSSPTTEIFDDNLDAGSKALRENTDTSFTLPADANHFSASSLFWSEVSTLDFSLMHSPVNELVS